jgi:hypothetical protein
MLRNGVDLVALSRLRGHTSIIVLQRYLKQLPDNLLAARVRIRYIYLILTLTIGENI